MEENSISLDLSLSFSREKKFVDNLENYRIFGNLKKFILLKHNNLLNNMSDMMDKQKYHQLMEIFGIKDYQNFIRLFNEWKNLKGEIPKKYFEILNISEIEIESLVHIDIEEFEIAKAQSFLAKEAIIRYMPCVYGRIQFPKALSEEEVIAFLPSINRNYPMNVNYGELKVLIWNVLKEYKFYFYEPNINTNNDNYKFRTIPNCFICS